MKIIKETSLKDFGAWSGAVNTLNRIINNDLVEVLESTIEDLYPDGMTDTELNDLLWFESDTVYEWVGLKTESEIEEELEEVKDELEELEEELKECENVEEEIDLLDNIKELKEKIEELEEELKEF